MSDVIPFQPRKRDETLRDVYGDDAYLLKWCAEWRAARAQQQKNWAEHELANGWGALPDAHLHLDLEPLIEMCNLESLLVDVEPHTVLLARELLGVALTILNHAGEDPEHTLADGPVLDIVRNVLAALNHMDGTTRLGERRARRRGRK
jgi:hypothetical protein